MVAAWPPDTPLRAAYLAQHAVLELCAQLQGSALAHRGQPVVDHGLPGLQAGQIDQNPLLQAAQHGTVQLPKFRAEIEELVGTGNLLPQQQVQFKNSFALQEAILHFNCYSTSTPEWIGQLLNVVGKKNWLRKEERKYILKIVYVKKVILSDLIWGKII